MSDLHMDEEGEEVRRLREALATVVRVSGRTRQALEGQLGLSSGYLSKILGGTVELRARHIFSILAAVELDPADFFRLALPRRGPDAGSKAARRLLENLEAALGHDAAAEPAAIPGFDEQVKLSLGRLLGLVAEGPKAG